MNTPGIFIGIDLGTSGCRAYAIDENKRILASSSKPLPESTAENQHIVQNPADWWRICKIVVAELLNTIDRNQVKAISIDGTSGTVLLCDPTGKPLTSGYMYNDSACTVEAQLIKNIAPAESGAHGASAGLAKCLYLQKLINDENSICLNQADWIAGNFLNRFDTSDENNALKLGYDPVQREWPIWLKQLSCLSTLPKHVLQPGDVSGRINNDIADFFNLPKETKIIAGTTDSIAAFIATGCSRIGEAVTSLGSTLAIKLISDKPVFSPDYGIYSHRLGDKWLVGGASNSGGTILKAFFSSEEMATLSKQITPDKPTALNYYPLLAKGERFPVSDPDLQPRLSPRPDSDTKFFQGILEGISQIEKMAFDKLVELGTPYPSHIVTMGGGSQNEGWRIIREKTCKIPISNADISEAAYGSALLAKQNYIRDKNNE